MPRLRSFTFASVALAVIAAPALAQEKRADTLLTVEKYLDFEQVAEPRVSSDGSQIIYTRRWVNKLEDRFESSMWIMTSDGAKNRFLATGGGAIWSPDGTRIAFLADGKPSGTQIFVRWMDALTFVGRPTESGSGSAPSCQRPCHGRSICRKRRRARSGPAHHASCSRSTSDRTVEATRSLAIVTCSSFPPMAARRVR